MSQERTVEAWPPLPFEAWRDTYAKLQLWLQIVGKIRLAQSAWINHSWHVTLYVTSRGLTTLAIPHSRRALQVDFDFIDHVLTVQTSDGGRERLPLEPQSVAQFYRRVMSILERLEVPVRINRMPNELANPIRFDLDEVHGAYDRDAAHRFWRVLLQADRVLNEFRAHFRGKSSPVHFFWGSTDLALTRFSGRTAPPHPGGVPHLPDRVLRDAYSHECWSCGFWPGGDNHPEAIFFAYAYPEPSGFAEAKVAPEGARYSDKLKEFVLPYEAVRASAAPDEAVLRFAQSTYDAAATLSAWDREALEFRRP